MGKNRGTHHKTVGRASIKKSSCGLCGNIRTLTKTHVPPQCAGNAGQVKRFTVISDDRNQLGRNGQRLGGIHLYGLCADCNSGLQANWDPAYCNFARSLWPFVFGDGLILADVRVQMPSVEIFPGAIARSVLASCFALNPNLRSLFRKLADDLVASSPSFSLPNDTAMYVGVNRGPQAIVTGSMFGFHFFDRCQDGSPMRTMSFAQVYFPPLAWQFASVSQSPLLEHDGWSDVSEWFLRDPTQAEVLNALLPNLRIVAHPKFDPGASSDWSEMFDRESCFIVRSDNAIATIRAKFDMEC